MRHDDMVEITLEGRTYTLALTLAVLDGINERYETTNAFIAAIQDDKLTEREQRDMLIWLLCMMINDDIERRREDGETDLPARTYTEAYIKRRVKAGEAARAIGAVTQALYAGLTSADIATAQAAMDHGESDPN